MQKREKRDLGLGQSAKSTAPNFLFYKSWKEDRCNGIDV